MQFKREICPDSCICVHSGMHAMPAPHSQPAYTLLPLHYQPTLRLMANGEVAQSVADNRRVSLSPVLVRGETHLMFYCSEDDNKAMTVQLKDSGCFILYRYMVSCFFDIPCVEAARIMCVSLSCLKRIRSWAKLECWPCHAIHSGVHAQFTREWVVHRRDEVILMLERKFLEQPSSMLGLAVGILKNVRQYAKIYFDMVIPGAGRRGAVESVVKEFGGKNGKEELKIKVKLKKIGKKGRVVRELMDSMKPRQAKCGTGGKKKLADAGAAGTVENVERVDTEEKAETAEKVETVDETITIPAPAPTPTTPEEALHPLQEEWTAPSPTPSFCQELDFLFASEVGGVSEVAEVEDELGLGPVGLF